MENLSKIETKLILEDEELGKTIPGGFVKYDSIKRKSSNIHLASSGGIIKKTKKRSPHKTLYEYLALKIWEEILKQYSDVNDLDVRSPKVMGLGNLNADETSLYMEFLNGYELQNLSQLKRTTPVIIDDQETPLPLYPACALHLGFLDAIKEAEQLLHSDYDSRHVIFTPSGKTSIGVVDLENSSMGTPEKIEKERKFMRENFMSKIISQKDKDALNEWYEQGRSSIKYPYGTPLVPKIIENLEKKLDMHIDFENRVLNGYSLPYTKDH